MGKRSLKENKNLYFRSREEAGLTRAQASEATGFLSESQIEKIEYEKTSVHPEDVLAMARAYQKPALCNFYCSHECPIGQEYVPEVKLKSLAQIILEILNSLNALNKEKERLVEITIDGIIDQNELRDFVIIEKKLKEASLTIDALQLWASNTIAEGKINAEELEEARRKFL